MNVTVVPSRTVCPESPVTVAVRVCSTPGETAAVPGSRVMAVARVGGGGGGAGTQLMVAVAERFPAVAVTVMGPARLPVNETKVCQPEVVTRPGGFCWSATGVVVKSTAVGWATYPWAS